MSEAQIQSYVHHVDKCFFISTIERDSSAMLGPGRYNETIVWNFDPVKRERGAMIHTDEDFSGSLRTHFKLCQEYYFDGKAKVDE